MLQTAITVIGREGENTRAALAGLSSAPRAFYSYYIYTVSRLGAKLVITPLYVYCYYTMYRQSNPRIGILIPMDTSVLYYTYGLLQQYALRVSH